MTVDKDFLAAGSLRFPLNNIKGEMVNSLASNQEGWGNKGRWSVENTQLEQGYWVYATSVHFYIEWLDDCNDIHLPAPMIFYLILPISYKIVIKS